MEVPGSQQVKATVTTSAIILGIFLPCSVLVDVLANYL
jgi:hypothetical protein